MSVSSSSFSINESSSSSSLTPIPLIPEHSAREKILSSFKEALKLLNDLNYPELLLKMNHELTAYNNSPYQKNNLINLCKLATVALYHCPVEYRTILAFSLVQNGFPYRIFALDLSSEVEQEKVKLEKVCDKCLFFKRLLHEYNLDLFELNTFVDFHPFIDSLTSSSEIHCVYKKYEEEEDFKLSILMNAPCMFTNFSQLLSFSYSLKTSHLTIFDDQIGMILNPNDFITNERSPSPFTTYMLDPNGKDWDTQPIDESQDFFTGTQNFLSFGINTLNRSQEYWNLLCTSPLVCILPTGCTSLIYNYLFLPITSSTTSKLDLQKII